MSEEPRHRPQEPRSYEEIEVISPDERRPPRQGEGEPPGLDADRKPTPDGAGVKP